MATADEYSNTPANANSGGPKHNPNMSDNSSLGMAHA
jgi:hypothetical protein